MTIYQNTEARDRIKAAIDAGILKRGAWGDGVEAVCMMSAIVEGARSTDRCATAGWPEWLVELNVHLFDVGVGAEDEDAAAFAFALDVAEAVSEPFDAHKARDLFCIRRLDTGDHSALKTLALLPLPPDEWTQVVRAVSAVAALLRRRVAGEDVANEMRDAYFAANDAANVADNAVNQAAAYAADAAASAAGNPARCGANYVAVAAEYAAGDVYAARKAAYAAARVDLVAAIREARTTGDDQ